MSEDKKVLAQRCADALSNNDRTGQFLGIQLEEIDQGYSKMSMRVCEEMLNGHDTCHGGLIFTLADSTFGYACNSQNQASVAQGCSIDFVRPAKLGDLLTATAEEKSRGKTTALYDIKVVRDDGKVIAFFRGKSYAIGQPLVE